MILKYGYKYKCLILYHSSKTQRNDGNRKLPNTKFRDMKSANYLTDYYVVYEVAYIKKYRIGAFYGSVFRCQFSGTFNIKYIHDV